MRRNNTMWRNRCQARAIVWRVALACLAASACGNVARYSCAQNPLAELVIETTRELDPQTAPELISAVNNLLNVGANDIAREYFLRLAQQELSGEDLATLYDQMGAATFFQFRREAALAPEGAEFAQRVISAAKAWAENPQQLSKQLAIIGGESAQRRLLALHRFAEGREQAAVMLLQKLADPKCPFDKRRLRTAWSFIGRPAEQPVLAALYARDAALQFEALQALSSVKPAAGIPHLAAYALNCQDVPLRQMALQMLHHSTPQEQRADLSRVAEQAIISRMRSARRSSDDTARLIWTWDDRELNARSRELPTRTAEFVEANRLCHKLASGDRRYAEMYLATELGLHYQLAREGDLPTQWDAFAQRYGATLTADMLSQSLAWSMQYDVPEAAITACEFLSVSQGASSGQVTLTGVAQLSEALRSPYVEIRETAALALMQIDPQVPFAGTADLLRTALQLATTRGQRRAMVVHPVAVEAEQLASLLINAGWLPDRANSGKKALRPLLDSADFELILLSTELFRPRYSELLQQLQGDYRTQSIPTVLLETKANLRGLDELELRWPNVQAFPFPFDEQSLDQLLRRAGALRERKSASTRIARAKIALRWLARLADDGPRRSFYELAEHDRQLAVSLDQPELLAEAALALGKLGTPYAQQALQAALNLAPTDSTARGILEQSLSDAVSRQGRGGAIR